MSFVPPHIVLRCTVVFGYKIVDQLPELFVILITVVHAISDRMCIAEEESFELGLPATE